MEYRPAEVTLWRDVSEQRAHARRERWFAGSVLLSMLFVPCASALAVTCLGPVTGTVVVVVLACWRYL